ncbi:TPA: histidine kinase, partial [Vibrio cholerae]
MNGAQAQLLQSEKMASVGQLAAGVTHEINNPIGFCLSNLNTLRDYVEVFAQLADFVEQSAPSFEGSEFYQAWMRFKQQHDLAF